MATKKLGADDVLGQRFSFSDSSAPDITIHKYVPHTPKKEGWVQAHALDGQRLKFPLRFIFSAIRAGVLVPSTGAPFTLPSKPKAYNYNDAIRSVGTNERMRTICVARQLVLTAGAFTFGAVLKKLEGLGGSDHEVQAVLESLERRQFLVRAYDSQKLTGLSITVYMRGEKEL